MMMLPERGGVRLLNFFAIKHMGWEMGVVVSIMQSTRVVFNPPSKDEFSRLLGKFTIGTYSASGGALDDIQSINFAPPTRLHQRGGGFFSTLANMAKTAAPFLFRMIAPSALQFTRDVVNDVNREGRSALRAFLRRRGFDALKGVGTRIMKGGKKKQKNKMRKKRKTGKRKSKVCKRKTRTTDLFDMV